MSARGQHRLLRSLPHALAAVRADGDVRAVEDVGEIVPRVPVVGAWFAHHRHLAIQVKIAGMVACGRPRRVGDEAIRGRRLLPSHNLAQQQDQLLAVGRHCHVTSPGTSRSNMTASGNWDTTMSTNSPRILSSETLAMISALRLMRMPRACSPQRWPSRTDALICVRMDRFSVAIASRWSTWSIMPPRRGM